MAARRPINLAKVHDVRQGADESSATFLERINEVFCRFTHVDPEKPEYTGTFALAFINQSAPDIRNYRSKKE